MTLDFYGGEDHQPFSFAADGGSTTGALLIHGFVGSPKELRGLGAALAAAGVDARGMLLPGFGADVDRLGAVRVTDWLAAANAEWDALTHRYERTILIGFSMGGAVALHLAARRPPDRLALLAPLFRIADRRARLLPLLKHVWRDFYPYKIADFSRESVRWDFRQLNPALHLDDPVVQAQIRRQAVIPMSSIAELQRLSRAAARAGRRATAPTLIVQGSQDPIVLPRDTRKLLAHLGGTVTYRELAADHMLPFVDRPWYPQVRDLILAFVAPAIAPPRPTGQQVLP